MPLLEIPTTQFSTTIREIKLKQSDICVQTVVYLTVELTDLATEITKYANLRTHIRKIINNYFK